MTNLPRYYDPLFTQLVVEYYLQDQPNVSFKFVGKIFQIKEGHVTLKQWFDRYDGTIVSLQQRYRSGRPRILSKRQVNQLVTKIVYSHNRLSRPINYTEITNSIRQKTNTNVSIRTVRRYGKNSGIKQRKTIKRTYGEISDTSCDAIAKLRCKLQRVSNNKIIFLDEIHVEINEAPRTTLAAPDEKPYVIITDSSSYGARYDMIAAIVGNQVLPPIIFTPQDRRTRKIKGINSEIFIDFIENVLCSSISELDHCPIYLVLDKIKYSQCIEN